MDKGFVSVEGNALHYVRHGRGPAVVMLHAAPCSSKVMAPTQRVWGERFTTIAFDLPGFGRSQLPEHETVRTEDLADMIAGGMRALGLSQAALYGRHTGAGVAVELARRSPELVSMVLTDGFPVFQNPYSEERIAEYLKPITPRWDGSHLVWAWFRYREQHIFWPWDRPFRENRADTNVPDLDFLYRGSVELLQAAPTYAKVYASAFRHAGLKMIGKVEPPVCFGNRPGDSQYKTVGLYPQSAWVKLFSRDHIAAAHEELEILSAHPAEGEVPPYRSAFALPGDEVRDYIPTRYGSTYARALNRGADGRPLLFLHELPGSLELHLDAMARLAASRPLIAVDLLGNGWSDPGTVQPSLDVWVSQIADCLDFLGFTEVDIHACGTAAAVAIEAARTLPGRIASVNFQSPPAIPQEPGGTFARDYAPDISPSWEGANFLRLWHHLRDQQMWWPWYERDRGHARTTGLNIEPETLQARCVAVMQNPQCYRQIWQEVLGYPLLERLSDLPVDATITAQDDDMFAFAQEAARQALHRHDNDVQIAGTDSRLC